MRRKKRTVAEDPEVQAVEEEEVAAEASEEEDQPVSNATLYRTGSDGIMAIRSQIAKICKFTTFEPEYKYWLDTGCPDMNATLGSPERGLGYGKIVELMGPEHGGKTTIATILAGIAQRDGAGIGHVDVEDSRDPIWARKLGLTYDDVLSIYPKLILRKKSKKDKLKEKASAQNDEEEEEEDDTLIVPGRKGGKEQEPVLESAEEMFLEAEAGMRLMSKHYDKQLWFVDSVANLQTEMQQVASSNNSPNMRANFDRAMFLSRTLPRWAGLAANYNVLILLLNQVRVNPNVFFGDNTDSPGGKSLRHNCAVRAVVSRLKGGRLLKNGKVIGLVSGIRNIKNKAGEGSVQSETCGFKVLWNRDPAKVILMSKDDANVIMKAERRAAKA